MNLFRLAALLCAIAMTSSILIVGCSEDTDLFETADLDVSSIDISILTVQSANITYSGSTIHAVINPDGYIASATYTIPLYVEGSASAIGISGSAVFTGQETESWTINW